MDHQRFDAISRLAATVPGRRNMPKLAGTAAVGGIGGFLAGADDAEAKTLEVNIHNIRNDQSRQVVVRAKTGRSARKIAAHICRAVDQININSFLTDGNTLECTYPGQ